MRNEPANGQPEAPNPIVAPAAFNGTVRRAFSSQSTLLGQGEHCSFDSDRLVSLGLAAGQQVRIGRGPDALALYTISETRTEPVETIVRMALAGRERLGTSEEFAVNIDPRVPHPTYSDEEAEAHSEFVERLDDDGCQQGLVVLAPHGGGIERNTDRQAALVGALVGRNRATVWTCKGFRSGGGAFARWHITSADIHEASFPLLRAIATRRFTYAVAFHGFSEADVLVGGTAPSTLKQEIATALAAALAGSGIEVRIATPSDGFDGDDPRNIVNRLTADGAYGVQIEQCLEARTAHWQPIAEAVAAVCDQRLPPIPDLPPSC